MAGRLQSSRFGYCRDDNGRCVVPMPDFCNNHGG
nr:MAG TPA_asm: nonstructural protein [Caudoviricetes sp.]